MSTYEPVKERFLREAEKLLGQKFGKLTVLEILGRRNECIWFKCQCECGEMDEVRKTHLTRGIITQCRKCSEAQRRKTYSESALEKAKKENVGKVYGELTVLDVFRTEKKRGFFFAKCRCSCGKITTPLLSVIKAGKIKSCGHETIANNIKSNLTGAYDGTLLSAIDGRRTLNSNNSTGVNGISVMKNGKYRAYINLRRKQYHLGVYDTLDEAVAARKDAERRMYGSTLKEAEENAPEIIEKIRSTKRGKTV